MIRIRCICFFNVDVEIRVSTVGQDECERLAGKPGIEEKEFAHGFSRIDTDGGLLAVVGER